MRPSSSRRRGLRTRRREVRYGLCSSIRANDDLQLTRIIGVSGRVTDGQAQQLLSQGFDAILRKPFTVRQVVETIDSLHSPI